MAQRGPWSTFAQDRQTVAAGASATFVIALPSITFPKGVDVVVSDGGSHVVAGSLLTIPNNGAEERSVVVTRVQ